MKIGYARVSTADQNLDLQLDALKAAGCDKIYYEKMSGAKSDRPELNRMRSELRAGDMVVVWKIDRLGRSLIDLLQVVNDFKEKEIGFCSINDSISTETKEGRLMFGLLAGLAEYERDMIKERTASGLEAARLRGRVGGRPPGPTAGPGGNSEVARRVASTLLQGGATLQEAASKASISRRTLIRWRTAGLLDILN